MIYVGAKYFSPYIIGTDEYRRKQGKRYFAPTGNAK